MWVAGAIVVSAVAGAVASSDNSRRQANTAADAAKLAGTSADKSLSLQERQWLLQQENQKPWLTAGKNALGQITTGEAPGGQFSKNFGMADFQADPGYAFRLSEGVKALDRSASAKGQLLSGSALKGVEAYGQNMGSQEYQNAYNRYTSNNNTKFNQLATVAGIGQIANNALGQAGATYATNAGNIGQVNATNQANANLAIGNINNSMYQGYMNGASNTMNSLGKWYQSTNNPDYTGDPMSQEDYQSYLDSQNTASSYPNQTT